MTGFNLRDLEAMAKHTYYETKKEGKNADLPLVALGAITAGIGGKMMWDGAGKKLWTDYVKQRAGQSRGFAEHARHAGDEAPDILKFRRPTSKRDASGESDPDRGR